jgi:hypothetical protein
MADFRLNRLWFWISVAVYFAIKIPLGFYVMSHLDSQQDFLGKLDTPLVIALAIFVGGRLNDAGRKRWIGIVTTLFIVGILPLVLVLGYIAKFPKPGGAIYSKQEFMHLASMFGLVSGILLIAFLIWVGTRPSRPVWPMSAKVEPRF